MQPTAFVERVRRQESLAGADLRQADPFTVDLSGFDLRETDVSRTRRPYVTGGPFWPGGFRDPVRKAWRHVRVRGADLSGARLDRILGKDGDFGEAKLVGSSLVEAGLRDADFTMADVRGADFTGSDLAGATFYGATSDETTVWPDGFRPA